MDEEKLLQDHNKLSCAAPRFKDMTSIYEKCYRKDDLQAFAKSINEHYGKILIRNINTKNTQELWDEITKVLGNKCMSDDCLLHQKDILANMPKKSKIVIKRNF